VIKGQCATVPPSFCGGGLSIITSSFPYLNNPDTTNTGVLVVGGVELFFAKVPKLGVSGELEFTPSSSPFRLGEQRGWSRIRGTGPLVFQVEWAGTPGY
jgi:hypothetical protein